MFRLTIAALLVVAGLGAAYLVSLNQSRYQNAWTPGPATPIIINEGTTTVTATTTNE